MDLEYDVKRLLPNEINKIHASDFRYNRTGSKPSSRWSYDAIRTDVDQLLHIIDIMGLASAKAQDLHHVITTGDKLRESDHVLYVMTDDQSNRNKVVGILKMGYKKLFLIDRRGTQHEMRPPCVLDFYVHESCQRMGFGKKLFEFMLRDLNVNVQQLAIDRPSPKFLAFLLRHYDLSNPVHQGNHFTVFEEMFTGCGDAIDSRWTKFRRSEPNNDHSKNNIQRTINRQSYPSVFDNHNADANLDKIHDSSCSSSVASVVFGHLRHTSQGVQQQNRCFSPNLRSGTGTDSLNLRPAIDSSFNIFGVPSPAYSGSPVNRG